MKNLKAHYFFTDFLTGIILIFLPLYCRSILGFDEFEIGIFYLFGGLVAVVNSLISSVIAQKINDKRRVFHIGILFTILGSILLMFSHKYLLVLCSFMLLYLFRILLYIIGDDIAISYAQKENIDFGKIRFYGSFGWGASFLISGIIILISVKLLLLELLVVTIILWINSFFLPKLKKQKEHHFEIKDLKKLFTYKNYWYYLFVFLIIWSVLNNVNIYEEYTIIDKGGLISIYILISILVIVLDAFIINKSNAILRKLKSRKYIIVAFLVIFTKTFLIYIYPIPLVVYATILLDPIMFGMLIPITSLFIKSEVDKNVSTIAITISSATTLISVSFFSPFFGYLYHSYGPEAVFGLMSIMVLIGLVLSLKIKFNKLDQVID